MLDTIYEWFFYDANYSLVFDNLYDNGGYSSLFLIAFLVPLFLGALFYFLWKYPYGRWYHYFFWFIVGLFTTFGLSYFVLNSNIFNSDYSPLIAALSNSDFYEFAKKLVMKLSIYNLVIAFIFTIIWSLIFKQFSKHQAHLPF